MSKARLHPVHMSHCSAEKHIYRLFDNELLVHMYRFFFNFLIFHTSGEANRVRAKAAKFADQTRSRDIVD